MTTCDICGKELNSLHDEIRLYPRKLFENQREYEFCEACYRKVTRKFSKLIKELKNEPLGNAYEEETN